MSAVATQTASDAETISIIQNDLDSNIYVEAGAGTGKTYSLVQRIVALLRGGVGIDEIIAITFTRAAASELRSRIRAELEDLKSADPADPHISAALEGIDTAAFQTIDSLVHSLLREYPLASGLPPSVELQSSYAEMQTFRDRWRQWSLEKLESDVGFSKALSQTMRLGLSQPFAVVSRLAQSMNTKHGELRNLALVAPKRIAVDTINELEVLIDDVVAQMRRCRDSEDKLYLQLETVVDWHARVVAPSDCNSEDDADEILATWPGARSTGGTMSNWGGRDGKAEAADTLQTVIDAVMHARSVSRTAATTDLIGYANQFVETIVGERRQAGTVTYYDAITWLIAMLERNGDIRRRVQRQYRRILVDEFQDTDPDQVKLVRLLTIPPDANRIAPGSLFVVGDPKQSIYRFRGAQVNVSQRVKGDVINDGAGGIHLTLKENRRSTTPIINWVNHVFGDWMPEESGQADWIPLDIAAETAVADDFGGVFYYGEPMDVSSVDEVREVEADSIAEIASAVCAGAVQVRDRHDGTLRASGPGDLTILTRSRTHWDTITGKFDELHLPYSALIGGAEVLETQEFRDLLNCLAAIDDPSDQPATVGALKSTYFGCSDVDLYHWAQAGGRFSCTADLPESSDARSVYDAMEVLRRYNSLRDEMQAPQLIERFIRERQGRELMFMQDDPSDGLRRLDLAIEQARLFTDDDAASLRECLTRFNQYRQADESIREQPSLEFDEGKIRLMTMHASKGLEFPVVILADLCGSRRPDNPELLIDWQNEHHAERNVAFRLGGTRSDGYFQTDGYEVLSETNTSDDALEKTRLLYVAATRARDHLIVSRFRKARDTKVDAAQIENHVGNAPNLWSPVPPHWETIKYEPTQAATELTRNGDAHDRDMWVNEHNQLLKTATRRTWLSPSSLKHETPKSQSNSHADKPDFVPVLDDEANPSRGRAASKLGIAVHAAVQRCLEQPDADINFVANNEAASNGIHADHAEVARLTRATLESPLVRRVRAMPQDQFWVETPVAVPIAGPDRISDVLEGRVDLIYRCDDGTLGIVDFKTDRSFNRSVAEMAEPYTAQLGAYAHAVQRATGIEVSTATLVFSRIAAEQDDEGEYTIQNIEDAVEKALELASTRHE